MWWPWAFWIAQRVHTHQVIVGTSLPPSWVAEKAALALDLVCGTPAIILYCGNLTLVSIDEERVDTCLLQAVTQLRRYFPVQEICWPSATFVSLGYLVQGDLGLVWLAPARREKLKNGVRVPSLASSPHHRAAVG